MRATVGPRDAAPHPAAGEACCKIMHSSAPSYLLHKIWQGDVASLQLLVDTALNSFRLHVYIQPTLERLPALALAEDAAFENDFLEPVAALTDVPGSAPAKSSANGAGARQDAPRRAKPPCPVDLAVPPQAAVVMITGGRPCRRTCAIIGRQCHQCVRLDLCSQLSCCSTVWVSMHVGPNTGGKTASLKAFGLAALMAKAGLFLPVAAGQAPPQLLWFDKVRHITKLCSIMSAFVPGQACKVLWKCCQ